MDNEISVNVVKNLNKHTVAGLVLITLFISAAVVFIAAIYFVWAPESARQQATHFVRGFHLDKKGDQIPVPERMQIGFWTPNQYTKKSTDDSDSSWQELSANDSKLTNFEDYLDTISFGWRRYEQIGKGSTRKKNGNWWIVSVSPSFQYKPFLLKYRKIWGAPEDHKVYVEEYINQAKYHKARNK